MTLRIVRPLCLVSAGLLAIVLVYYAMQDSGVEVSSSRSASDPAWAAVEAPPLTARTEPVFTWTGEELIIFGGSEAGEQGMPANDGASYDPETGSWSALPAAPFEVALLNPAAVWTGSELVVLGVPCSFDLSDEEVAPDCVPGGYAGAAYNPQAAMWETVELPVSLQDKSGYQSPPKALGWSGSEANFEIVGDYYAYSPSKSSWRGLPQPPFDERKVCVSESGTVAVGYVDQITFEMEVTPQPASGELEVQDIPSTDGLTSDVKASTLDPTTNTWSPVANSAANGAAPLIFDAICAADSALLLPAEPGMLTPIGHVYDLSSRVWSLTPPALGELGPRPTLVATDTGVLAWGDSGVLSYDLAGRVWRSEPNVPEPAQTIWAGGRVVALPTSRSSGQMELDTYVPN